MCQSACYFSRPGPDVYLKSTELGCQATATQFYDALGCTGRNRSPQLSWENAPAGTQSFAVTLYDKDAPTGSGWWHWVIFNIPAVATGLSAGAGDVHQVLAPAGSVQSLTDFGQPSYGGPCPPPGRPHQYLFIVYALKTRLALPATALPALVGLQLGQASLAQASLVMYGQR